MGCTWVLSWESMQNCKVHVFVFNIDSSTICKQYVIYFKYSLSIVFAWGYLKSTLNHEQFKWGDPIFIHSSTHGNIHPQNCVEVTKTWSRHLLSSREVYSMATCEIQTCVATRDDRYQVIHHDTDVTEFLRAHKIYVKTGFVLENATVGLDIDIRLRAYIIYHNIKL